MQIFIISEAYLPLMVCQIKQPRVESAVRKRKEQLRRDAHINMETLMLVKIIIFKEKILNPIFVLILVSFGVDHGVTCCERSNWGKKINCPMNTQLLKIKSASNDFC